VLKRQWPVAERGR
jgi:hypothetical protein